MTARDDVYATMMGSLIDRQIRQQDSPDGVSMRQTFIGITRFTIFMNL